MRENRSSGSMRGGVRRSLVLNLSIRRLRLLYSLLAVAAWLAVAAAWPVRADAAPDKEEKTRRYTLAEKSIQHARENLPKQVSTENPELTKLVHDLYSSSPKSPDLDLWIRRTY